MSIQSIQPPTKPPVRRGSVKGRNRPLEAPAEEGTGPESVKRKSPAKGGKRRKWKPSAGLKRAVLYPMLLMGVGLLLVAANSYVENMPLRDVAVKVQANADNAFLDMADVRQALLGETQYPLIGQKISDLNLAELENRLEANPYVEEAEVHKSMLGVLHVDVQMRRAVGRLINNSGSHLYLDPAGHKFPTSRHHTAYVPLIRGDFEEGVVDTFSCGSVVDVLPLLNYLQEDDFWQAQIAEIVIAPDGQLKLTPAIGSLPIEFGFPVRIEEKFQNLMDFYKQVIPEVGWKKYRAVSVKYRGQVVARR